MWESLRQDWHHLFSQQCICVLPIMFHPNHPNNLGLQEDSKRGQVPVVGDYVRPGTISTLSLHRLHPI